jgi:hypothetical protein
MKVQLHNREPKPRFAACAHTMCIVDWSNQNHLGQQWTDERSQGGCLGAESAEEVGVCLGTESIREHDACPHAE